MLQGRDGVIKHLFRSFTFLHSRLVYENGGMFVSRSRDLLLAGGNRPQLDKNPLLLGAKITSPRLHIPLGSSSRNKKHGISNQHHFGEVKRDKEIIGKTIKINGGPYKGNVMKKQPYKKNSILP